MSRFDCAIIPMTTHVWLRAETKPTEARTPIMPTAARALLAKGFRVTVEASPQRCVSEQAYRALGCEIVAAGAWQQAPATTLIMGLKELPVEEFALRHRHIHFAHVFKYQRGWRECLQRFHAGSGGLYDLEYLVDDQGKRVAAFGYWAGFIGAALAVQAWCDQQLGRQIMELQPFANKQVLLDTLLHEMLAHSSSPRMLIIGAQGRCGRGAQELANCLNLTPSCWDIEQTKAGGPFEAILDYDIFINCVLVADHIPPFLNRQTIRQPQRKLSVIADVSCDPYGPNNPLPIYDHTTHFKQASMRLLTEAKPLDLIAIDHLPSLLPLEASEEFSAQLLPSLLQLDALDGGVWLRAARVFQQKLAELN